MARHRYAFFDTSIGNCILAWSEDGVCDLLLPDSSDRKTLKRLGERFENGSLDEAVPTGPIKKVMAKIKGHLSGQLCTMTDIEVDYRCLPPFFVKVYKAARAIPAGKTLTYGQLAMAAGSPAAARAVGRALARNPLAIIVPCHRVLGAGGKPVGFSAYGGCQLKEKLLLMEGVSLNNSSARQPGMRFAPGRSSRLKFDETLAVKQLCSQDAILAKLVGKVGPFRLEVDEMLSPFEALAESIVYQQLTGKAAATIYSRVKALYVGGRLPQPQAIIDTADQTLRAAGLSGAKTAALKDLALKQRDGLVPTLEQLNSMGDEEIVQALTTIRGIGRWTVEMLLIFRLGRLDVLPAHDYGVRKGFACTYSNGNLPTPKELEQFGESWRPFRSVAAWYMWRATELPENKRKP